MTKNAFLLSACLLAFIACDKEEDGMPLDDISNFPQKFKLVGEAKSTVGDYNIDCNCDLVVELERAPANPQREYQGIHGGNFRRTVLAQDGSGISLQPDVYGDIILKFLPNDSIELVIPINLDAASRFYRETAIFRGSRENATEILARGKWKCAPFDIKEGGWVDTTGTVEGTWRIVPQ